MIKMEYIRLPTTTLSLDFMYKLSGQVSADWREGKVSHALLTLKGMNGGEIMRAFANSEAALMEYNLSNTSGGEFNLFQNTPVKLVEYEAETVNDYSEFEDEVKTDRAEDITKTDKLIVEYLHLPMRDTKYHYLMRFVRPIGFAWQLKQAYLYERDTKLVKGDLVEFNKHISLHSIIKDTARSSWYEFIDQSTPREHFPVELEWMLDMKHVEVRECELVEKK